MKPSRGWQFNGAKFREVRRGRKLSLMEFCEAVIVAGVSVNKETVRKWEIGLSEPRASQLWTAAAILQSPPALFMARREKPGEAPE